MYTGTAQVDGVTVDTVRGTMEQCIEWAERMFLRYGGETVINISREDGE